MKKMLLTLLIIGFAVTVKAENTEKKKEIQLGDITVTAQKTEENLRDVPVSVSVFNDLALEDLEIKNLGDLYNYIPNVSKTNAGVPSVRGISSNTGSLAIGLYVDGVPATGTVGFMSMMNGVERVEVLRGPQGTLYGKNTLAGVINVITKKPGNEREGKVYAEIGEDNKYEIGGSINTPIIQDKFYMGLTGRYYQKEGFVENTYLNDTANDDEDFFGKLYLRLTPTDRLDIALISSTYQPDNGSTGSILVTDDNYLKIRSDLKQYSNISQDIYALNISYQFDNFTLNSVTSYKETEIDSFTDTDRTPDAIQYQKIDMPYKSWAQELRINGEKGKLKWLAGLYADKFKKSGGFSRTFITKGFTYENYSDINQNTIGIFGHVDYQLTDRFSATFGLRYDDDHKEIDDFSNDEYDEADYSAFSPKFALQYKLNDQVTTYATVAKGYKSGGFYMFAADGYPTDYDQEILWNYEVGIKSVLMDNRLMLNAAVYYMDHSDMQALTTIEGGLGYISNAASATSIGLELDSNFIINKNFSAFANLGISDSKFDEFSDAKGVYDDNDKTYAPHYTYAVGLKYRGNGGLYASVDVTGYGKSYLDNANKYEMDAYELLNAKIGYEWEHVDFYIYGKNILDEEYYQEAEKWVTLSDPGEFGVRLTWRF